MAVNISGRGFGAFDITPQFATGSEVGKATSKVILISLPISLLFTLSYILIFIQNAPIHYTLLSILCSLIHLRAIRYKVLRFCQLSCRIIMSISLVIKPFAHNLKLPL